MPGSDTGSGSRTGTGTDAGSCSGSGSTSSGAATAAAAATTASSSATAATTAAAATGEGKRCRERGTQGQHQAAPGHHCLLHDRLSLMRQLMQPGWAAKGLRRSVRRRPPQFAGVAPVPPGSGCQAGARRAAQAATLMSMWTCCGLSTTPLVELSITVLFGVPAGEVVSSEKVMRQVPSAVTPVGSVRFFICST